MLPWPRLRFCTHSSVAIRRLDAAQLERRVLFSAVPLPGGLADTETFDPSFSHRTLLESFDDVELLPAASNSTSELSSNESLSDASGLELVFLDADLAHDHRILQDLLGQAPDGRHFEIVVLDDLLDGVTQITAALESYQELEAVHIVSHGANGRVQLGVTWLSDANIDQFRDELGQWGESLADGADLLFYGCDLASSEAGRNLSETIGQLTGADVAASDNLTGAAELGGDWLLEYQTGDVVTHVAFSATLQSNWNGVLATVTVTQTADVVNALNTSSLANLMADDGGDGISLREALLAAAAGDEIQLDATVYELSIAGDGEDDGVTGDLDILRDVRITGMGAETIIDGGEIDRVFEVHNSALLVEMFNLTITGGRLADKGGGIFVDSNVTLDLQQVIVTENFADDGAGIFNRGTLIATDSVISYNGDGSTDEGGGLHNKKTATLERVTVNGNIAAFGGGIHNDNTANLLTLTNVTVSGNTGFDSGGGLYNQSPAEIYHATFTLNQAMDGGGIRSNGGSLQMVNTIVGSNTATNVNSDIMGAVTSLGNNLIGDSTGATGFIGSDLLNVDPELAPLADAGGFGQTHRLLPGSPAVDAASGSALAVDQNGFARPIDSDGNGTPSADIGSVEAFDTLVNTPDLANAQETSGETLGSQQAIAVDGSGNYVVVWSSNNQDGDGWGVYAKRFSASGIALTGEILVNFSTAQNQKWARVASDAAGNFVVTWTHVDVGGIPQDVYFRGFSASGLQTIAETRANNTVAGSQSDSVIAMDATTGDFVIAWEGSGPADTNGIFFRRFAANGTAKGLADELAHAVTGTPEIDPAIAMLLGGSFVVGWENDSTNKVYFQRFDSLGGTAGGRVQIDSFASTSSDLVVSSDASGNFTFVFRENVVLPGIYRRGFQADGTNNYFWTSVAGDDVFDASIQMAADGSAVITWHESGSLDVFARKMNPNGSFNGSAIQVPHWTAGNQSSASVAVHDANSFAVVWSGEGEADDSGVYLKTFNPAVSAVNSPPTAIVPATVSINENTDTSAGVAVGTLVAIDPDSGDVFSFSIGTGGDSVLFSIGGSNQLVLTDGVLDFETKSSYTVTVRVTDSALNTYDETITISVTNVNEAPTAISPTAIPLAEGTDTTGGLTVATLVTTDEDPVDTATYTLVVGGDSALFSIGGTDRLVLADGVLDFETKPSYTVTVRVTDSGSNTYDETLTVNVSNVNETPTAISPNSIPVADGIDTTGGLSVATLVTTDEDLGDTASFQVRPGGDAAHFVIGGADSDELIIDDGILDSSVQSLYSVTVRVTDGAGNTYDEPITISLGGSPPTDIMPNGFSVNENTQTSSGYQVGTLTALDPNASETFSYSILPGGDASLFSIGGTNADRLVIRDGILDFELRATYSVNVRVTDSTSNTYDETIVVTVIDLNEPPRVSLSPSVVTLPEDADVNSAVKVADITVTDDALGTANLSLAGADAKWFKIVGTELRLRANAPLDYEANPDWHVIVQVDDVAIGSDVDDSRVFQLQLTDVNEEPVASSDRFVLGFGSLSVAAPGVLSNDLDPEGTALSVVLVTPPVNGALQLNSDGSFTFVPNDGFFGSDQFTYRVEDATGESSVGVVQLSVQIPLQPASTVDVVRASNSEDDSTDESLPDVFPIATSSGDSSRTSGFPAPTRTRTPDGATTVVVPPFQVVARGTSSTVGINLFDASSDSSNSREVAVQSATTQLVASMSNNVPYTAAQMFGTALDEIREHAVTEQAFGQMVVGTTMLLSSGLSVGYVIWLIRGGLLLSSLVSSMPAWRLVDPLPVLGFMDEDDGEDDDDSLSTLVAESNSKSMSKVAS